MGLPGDVVMERIEQRKRARISGRFWVAVEGVDDYPRLRSGNISFTGVYFETHRVVGDPGSVQWLYLSASEQGTPVEVMARVSRVVALEDARRERVPVGLALEFMPATADARAVLQALVRDVGTLQLEARGQLEEGEAVASGRVSSDSTVGDRPLGVREVSLDTDWSVEVGETLQIDLRLAHTGRQGSFEGRVVDTAPLGDGRWRVTVGMTQELLSDRGDAGRVAGEGVVDLLFSGIDAAQPLSAEGEQLVGSLSRIKLTSLLSFFELERISGVLQLRRENEEASVFIHAGQIVDVEPQSRRPAVARLGELLRWTEGTFEFHMGPVSRTDRVGRTTTALLLELAVAQDQRG